MRGLGSGTPPSLMARPRVVVAKEAELDRAAARAVAACPSGAAIALGKAREEPAVERVVGKVGDMCHARAEDTRGGAWRPGIVRARRGTLAHARRLRRRRLAADLAPPHRLAHPEHHGDPLRPRRGRRGGGLHDLLHRTARRRRDQDEGGRREEPEPRADPRARGRSRRRQCRGERARPRRDAARVGRARLRDVSADGGRGHPLVPRSARSRAADGGRRIAGTSVAARSAAGTATGRRAAARLLSHLAPAVHDDQPRHLRRRHVLALRGRQRLRRASPAVSGSHAGRRRRGPAGRHPASRRALPLPADSRAGLLAVSGHAGGAGRPHSLAGWKLLSWYGPRIAAAFEVLPDLLGPRVAARD